MSAAKHVPEAVKRARAAGLLVNAVRGKDGVRRFVVLDYMPSYGRMTPEQARAAIAKATGSAQ